MNGANIDYDVLCDRSDNIPCRQYLNTYLVLIGALVG